MLNYQAIEQAVNREENAGGFAKLMNEFLTLGVTKYDYRVAEGTYRYYDQDSFIDLQMNGVPKTVTSLGETLKIKQAVKQAQSGLVSFEEFCALAGASGVAYWTTDLHKKEVTYYDEQDYALLIESIPEI